MILMVVGTWLEHPATRAWGLLFGVLAVGLCIRGAVLEGVETVKEDLTKYVFKVFEDGFKGGVEAGREMEAAERFIASAILDPERPPGPHIHRRRED